MQVNSTNILDRVLVEEKTIENLPLTPDQKKMLNNNILKDRKTPDNNNQIKISLEELEKYLSKPDTKQAAVTDNAHYVRRSDGSQFKIERKNIA